MDKLSIPSPDAIANAAKLRGWSVQKLCDQAGIASDTFYRWRQGKHHIGVDKLQLLLNALDQPD